MDSKGGGGGGGRNDPSIVCTYEKKKKKTWVGNKGLMGGRSGEVVRPDLRRSCVLTR
jgi:hypothetical protein